MNKKSNFKYYVFYLVEKLERYILAFDRFKMHSINNLFKFNKSEKKTLDFSSMNVSDLKIHQEKMKKIIANRKLVDSLLDRGERVKKQLSLVEVRTYNKSINFNNLTTDITYLDLNITIKKWT